MTASSTTPQEMPHAKKRTRNLKNNPKSSEQLEIDYLKIELGRAQTNVLALETLNKDLERKVTVMKEVIKMHEEKQVSNAYASLFPDSVPPPSSQPTEQVHSHPGPAPRNPSQYFQDHSQLPCHARPCPCLPWNQCCCTRCRPPSHNINNNNLRDSEIELMKNTIDKLRGEVVDIVDKLERFDMKRKSPQVTEHPHAQQGPLYHNPQDIPVFDHLETVLEVEVNNQTESQNNSVVSVDEFVPDVLLHPPPMTGSPQDNVQHLNYQGLTSQQI